MPYAAQPPPGFLDFGLRRNDGGGRRHSVPIHIVIPPISIIPIAPYLSSFPPPIPSFPRKRESTPRQPAIPYPHIQRRDAELPYAAQPPPGFWIPACAGMTVGGAAIPSPFTSSYPHQYHPPLPHTYRHSRPSIPSFPRKRESTPRQPAIPYPYPQRREAALSYAVQPPPGFWIPAYAGMTVGGGVIPPQAVIYPRPTPASVGGYEVCVA